MAPSPPADDAHQSDINHPGPSTMSPSGKPAPSFSSNSVWTPEETKRRIDESWQRLPRWVQVRAPLIMTPL